MYTARNVDLTKLNSLTKYPSIPTYHTIDKGILGDVAVRFDGPILLTEKIDGTNARIILLANGDYILGSREELLYAKGDLIGNPQLGIVEHLRPIADELRVTYDGVIVIYGELFGGKIGAASKNYTSDQSVGFRVFDIQELNSAKMSVMLELPTKNIAVWRDNGGQLFLNEDHLDRFIGEHYELLSLAPRLMKIDALPTSLEDSHMLLRDVIHSTGVALDNDANGSAEGIVARSLNRTQIAKLRFEDYAKTLRKKK